MQKAYSYKLHASKFKSASIVFLVLALQELGSKPEPTWSSNFMASLDLNTVESTCTKRKHGLTEVEIAVWVSAKSDKRAKHKHPSSQSIDQDELCKSA